ncbi:MAG: tripartite tricarboxylate transporter TctB family protein [Candidatus Rokubacteria bacterium]|nr:tripartite tricarboxylate transporter TctB family protein [Candidatus Rokubacteria bacterium]MBI3109098.1 tripartite tricarboxylate transporter TctB family protein [Candidatus Rokubacteria bacterium]
MTPDRAAWSDVVGGAAFLALASVVCVAAARLSVGTALAPGPGFYPLVLGIALAVPAAVLFVRGVRRTRTVPAATAHVPPGAVLVVAADLLVYPVLLTYLGFVVATLVFLVVIFRGVELKRWLPATVTAALITLVAYLVFAYALRIPFPRGLWS